MTTCPEKAQATKEKPATGAIVLVGAPNVGKSLLFHRLTGTYATVSNYPGTTIEVAHGVVDLSLLGKGLGDRSYELLDTPGLRSLLPITEEEQITKEILLRDDVAVIVHVVDAKDLERSLALTLQLMELGPPVVLVLNMIDEATKIGLEVDSHALAEKLGIPVVVASALQNRGISELKDILARVLPLAPRPRRPRVFTLDDIIETHRRARALASEVLRHTQTTSRFWSERLSQLTLNPFTGGIMLALVLWGLYEFVGVFGAQIAVGFLENTVFGEYINPWVTQLVQTLLPWAWAHDLLVGEYGIITLGLRYAIAIILPIVTTFFLAFALIEDSGYLPRLAMLIDRLFKGIGLSGRAVIPIVLGFGCDTMATLVTRTLETRREKLIATLLLALAIPCSAQLGVILGLLAGNSLAVGIWAGVIALNFLVIGYLTAKLLPGERSLFYIEIPPLRWPSLSNVLVKTYVRVRWYLGEIVPFFLIASVVIWMGQIIGIFDVLVNALAVVVGAIGLPKETAVAFLFGFFRRDYGAAGLYDLHNAGALSGVTLVVASVTLTLFVPCIAQFMITAKERGWKTAIAMAGFIFPYAFFVGWVVNLVLTTLGVRL
ncbi:MAG: ferrous iron transporter B [Candidatus Bipolaricaulota bacterium]|nr:ferrous iron transporter B [Candidatus Bipolaricaulota bacterium]MDW8031097.1 ferrous iron transporter B [Candidatus Bipolaricaulota bacterium]